LKKEKKSKRKESVDSNLENEQINQLLQTDCDEIEKVSLHSKNYSNGRKLSNIDTLPDLNNKKITNIDNNSPATNTKPPQPPQSNLTNIKSNPNPDPSQFFDFVPSNTTPT